MGKARIVLGLAGILLLSGCHYVKKSDFDARMASVDSTLAAIKVSGDSVNRWIDSAHVFLKWIYDNRGILCNNGCDPVPPPSDPPPDPDWGG